MTYFIDFNQCTGCASCKGICPTNSIQMLENTEGFTQICINTVTCVECGLCGKVCPVNRELGANNHFSSFVARTTNNEIRKKSTSGGGFSVLAEKMILDGGIVIAPSFVDMRLMHIKIDSLSQVEKVYGSKYVQSDNEGTFGYIDEAIKENKKILYVGTPCQIAGIYNYFSLKKYDRNSIVLVQLKCYGVPSPGLFRRYISWLEDKYKKRIINIFFRDKTYGYSSGTIRVLFEDKSSLVNQYDIKSYSNTFFLGCNIRTSCYDCRFRDIQKSNADFVIGDFNDFKLVSSKWNDDQGTSILYINTQRIDNSMIKQYSLEKEAVSVYEEFRNPIKNPLRDDFFCDAEVMEWQQLIKKYYPQTIRDMLATFFKPVIPQMPCSKKIFQLIKEMNTKKYRKRTIQK